jgi:hypothetical protein
LPVVPSLVAKHPVSPILPILIVASPSTFGSGTLVTASLVRPNAAVLGTSILGAIQLSASSISPIELPSVQLLVTAIE